MLARVSLGQSDSVEVVESIFDHTARPSLITVGSYQDDILIKCSGESRKVLDAWLQFLMIYGQFELRDTPRNENFLKAVITNNSARLDSITPGQAGLLRPLVTHLLEYHEKIVATASWQEKIGALASSSNPGTLLEQMYAAGFSKSENTCFIEQLSLQAESPPQFYAGDRTSLEKWFYTFWVRRFSEGTMTATHLGLALIERSLGSPKDSTEVSFVHEFLKIQAHDQPPMQTSALNIYRNLLVSTRVDGTQSIRTNGRGEKALPETIYAFAGAAHGKMAQYTGSQEHDWDGGEPGSAFSHTYSVDGDTTRPISFFSVEPVTEKFVQYLPAAHDEAEAAEIATLMEKTFGSPWGIEETNQGKRSCTDSPGTIRSFTSEANQVYVIEKECTRWTGEGTDGPYIVAVAVRDPVLGLYIKHHYVGLSGLIFIYGNFMVDLDNDGNVEVLLQTSAGLSSDLYLVELSRNGWTQLRALGEYSEGGYEEHPERSVNESLLFSK